MANSQDADGRAGAHRPERPGPGRQAAPSAVGRHIFEEEGTWFLDLKKDYDDQAFLTRRFREEFDRYVARLPPSSERPSFADEGEIYQKPLG